MTDHQDQTPGNAESAGKAEDKKSSASQPESEGKTAPQTSTSKAEDKPSTEEKSSSEDASATKKEVADKATKEKTSRRRQRQRESQPKRPSKIPAILSIFAFLVAVGSVAVGGFLYLNQQKLIEKMAKNEGAFGQRISQFDQKLGQTNGKTQQLFQQHQDAQNAVKQLKEQLTYNTRKLAEIPGTTREDWKLAEVEYLLRLANQRILLERDPQGAYALLMSADGVLQRLGNPDLYPIREKINADLLKLQMVKRFDREGVFLRIQSLMSHIEELPYLPSIETVSPQEHTTTVDSSEPSHWSDKVLEVLKPFVRFGRDEVVLEPLLTPQQHYYLQQNLRLMLEQVQLAVIKEEPALYQASLKKAKSWVNQYFMIHDEKVKVMNQHLDELLLVQVRPELPKISGSLQALLEHMAQQFPTPLLETEKRENNVNVDVQGLEKKAVENNIETVERVEKADITKPPVLEAGVSSFDRSSPEQKEQQQETENDEAPQSQPENNNSPVTNEEKPNA